MKKVLIPVKKTEEPWTVIHLEDGAILRCKTVITGVVRLQNDNGEWTTDKDGFPEYGIMAGPLVVGLEKLPVSKKEMN